MSGKFVDSKSVIWLISTYPPGYGGVSVHTYNLIESLRLHGMNVNLIRINGPVIAIMFDFFRLLTRVKKKDAVHLHTSFFSTLTIVILHILFLRRLFNYFRLIVSIHEGDLDNRIKKNSFIRNHLIKRIISNVDRLVLMSNSQLKNLKQYFKLTSSVNILSPMIVDNEVNFVCKQFLDTNHLKLLVVAQINELYGILEILEGIDRIAKDKPFLQFSLLLVFGSKNSDENYRKKIIDSLKRVNQNILVNIKEDLNIEEMKVAYRESDIFIRNTKVDSYGISVSEALCNGLYCLATDVCDRPEGVWVYPVNSFLKNFEEFLDFVCKNNNVDKQSKVKFLSSSFKDYNRLYFG